MCFLGSGIAHLYLRQLEREFSGFLPRVDHNLGNFFSSIPDDKVEPSLPRPSKPHSNTCADGTTNSSGGKVEMEIKGDNKDSEGDVDGKGSESDESGGEEDGEDDKDDRDKDGEGEEEGNKGSKGDEQGSGTLESNLGFDTL